MNEILKQLNPAQREAVMNYHGPSLIVAGAGSGKTRVLTARIAYMITDNIKPSSILALTFTNKAAKEMRDRIENLIPPLSKAQAHYIWMGTFHSIFLRILHAQAEKIDYPPVFTVYDTTDSVNIVKSIIKELALSDDVYKPRAMFAQISRLKNDLISPVKYEEDPVYKDDDNKRKRPRFIDIYKTYVARCRANGAMDFDDLLVNMVVLLERHPDVLEYYQKKFQYILVDEYQDTNLVQYKIVKMLAAAHENICVVGDDSQSIYSFRGARIENILNFKRDFPGAQVYKLEQNYRSTQTIVNAANSVIANNASSRELKKECFSDGEKGEKIRLLRAYTDREEAELVAGEIKQLGRGGVPWEEIAVLYRVNALSRVVEESLRRRDIPYKIYRGHSFYDRKEVKDLIAYFRLITNPRDDEAFRRIINYPARGIGEVTVGKISAAAREKSVSLWEVATATASCATQDDSALAKKLAPFTTLIHELALEREQKSLYEFGRDVATRTGIMGGFKADGSAEAISALENIDELLNSMAAVTTEALEDGVDPETPPSLEEWLQNVALMTDMDNDEPENRNKVALMTVHAAKGLEFRHVFIMGMEEELFPSLRDGDHAEIEEERRLFYVALTRAKERSFVSLADQRFIHGNMDFRRPSRFVREIDEKYLDGSLADTAPPVSADWAPRKPTWESRAAGRPAWEPRKPEPPRKVAPITPETRFRKIGTTTRPVPSGMVLDVGIRVAHAKFGTGTVVETEPAVGGDLKITVVFDDPAQGRKTLLSKYARLETI
uniref:DNA 3'-5' helicase n=1 Tax=termite gut metagenome TaxID=433724 RepID=S0DE87_9ZZZZ